MITPIEKSVRDTIRKNYIKGPFNKAKLAAELNITRKTVRKYVRLCRLIDHHFPDKLHDMSFWIPKVQQPYPPSPKHLALIELFPSLIDISKSKKLGATSLFKDYKKIYPNGFCLCCFSQYYVNWRRSNNICSYMHRRVRSISDEDKIILTKWKNAFDRKQWERATAILESFNGKPLFESAAQMDRPIKTILKWISNYKEKGIDGLIDKPYTLNEDRTLKLKIKQDNIVKLLHESPQLHGLNRSSWRLEDLVAVYKKTYHEAISRYCISDHLGRIGYSYKKSREVLTSPDPKFREKVNHIKRILSNLTENEKFFSVDEFGHFSVKLKGGRTFVKDGNVAIPQLQKSKGFLIVTAALELSGNQITHFYSREKNTDEMIKLIEVLIKQYHNSSKLYISWDAAQWHNSKKLKERIIELNDDKYRNEFNTPIVELAPLPSSAQFLNVIESIFSGLARAVIHNSDYQTLDECMAAIDKHFEERNAHFKEHPKRAGSYLWRNENMKPVFNEVNNCKMKRSLKIY